MIQNDKKQQDITIYEIDNKKYTVISKCIENVQDTNKLYDIICQYVISQID